VSQVLTKKDFSSDQEVRWCPGCGDYAILSAVQKVMPELGIPKEKIVFVSGIGCSSRFPYYMNTYGFHTIHGRAPAIATGLRLMRQDLTVWVITGDGDSLSIGGNHLIHVLRRNVDLNILMFNNEIYGLTKGQYSPTSARGTVAKSTPEGSLDTPFSPVRIAHGAGGSFIARANDKDMKLMEHIFRRAQKHRGTSFIEILQNCVIFNDGVFDPVTDREHRMERTINVEHGQKLLFGRDHEKGLRLKAGHFEVVNAASHPDEVSVFNENDPAFLHAFIHAENQPEIPVAMGVLYREDRPVYEEDVERQVALVTEKQGPGDLKKLLYSGEIWEIK
jgi:2-oxoglutarate ferredoxin oxidoreductase subunit beta